MLYTTSVFSFCKATGRIQEFDTDVSTFLTSAFITFLWDVLFEWLIELLGSKYT